jgi:hypothetical protein
MRKVLLLTLLFALFIARGFSQTDKFWSLHNENSGKIITDKAVARQLFPTAFKLFDLNSGSFRQELFSVTSPQPLRHSAIISLPNADGKLEQFEVFEASNFEPALQVRFPEIRAFSGKGITDKYATLKLSISPQGIQTMIFRTDKENEFIEPYSADHTVYAVFKSERKKGELAWSCSTDDKQLVADINAQIPNANKITSSTGELKTMLLAQSCTGEYSNYFGATNATQVALVLAAFNATITRCNGVYEKDLGLHLNLVATTTDVIFYDAATDPYSPAAAGANGAWNAELMNTLHSILGDAAFDIGHLFGRSGGGGNAGCIGCVCSNNMALDPFGSPISYKGSGFTSPADAIPQGDNFDIDYVVHEVGHQLGATHSFTFQSEGGSLANSSQREVGSGITIMGYAGITGQDVAPHSIDIFHETSIQQIQNNLATKSCPITTSISANNATPVVAPMANYIIPLSTPFELTGSATDANAGDALTYCWEQNDASTTLTGNNSVASATKLAGPNFLSFSPTASPTRYFPRLSSILAGAFVTGPLPGGDAVARIEALSSVARTLNFRLTVRDNAPYSSNVPIKVGQTAFTDMTVTVTNTSGPFMVTSPNSVVSWEAASSQTITWDVANSTLAPVNCSNVNILLSTDGGFTFPITLVANTSNDGSEVVTIPNNLTATARVKVQSVGNIFFDISNTNFNIIAAISTFGFSSPAPTTVGCGSVATATVTLGTTSTGGFSVPVVLTASGNPAGTTVGFSVNPVAPGSSTDVTLNNVNTLSPGSYNITITGTAGTVVQTRVLTFTVTPGAAPAITTQPTAQVICAGADATFTAAASGTVTYQWQVSTGGPFTNIAGATAATYTVTGATASQNGSQYHVVVSTLCGTATSNNALLTVNNGPAITAQPQNTTTCSGQNATFSVTATGGGLTYQWQSATSCAGPWVDIAGATAASYTAVAVTNPMNGSGYRVIVSGACPAPVTSNCATLTVGDVATITGQPVNTAVCVGSNASFSATATGTVTYQWQVSTGGPFTDISGATTAALNLTAVTAAMNGNQYHLVVFNCSGTGIISNNATLTVNTPVNITTQPANVTLCAGANAAFTVAATGSALTYQWQVSTNGGATFTNITGATAATLNVTAATAAMNGNQYHVVVTGPCNPGGVTSGNATLTVNTPVSITAQPVNADVCLPTTTTALFGISATGTGLTYQWQVSTNGGTTFTNIAGATNPGLTLSGITAGMNGNQYQVVLSGTCTATLVSAAATLQVNSLVQISTQPTAQAACTNDDAIFSVAATSATPTNITYQWQVSINGSAFVNLGNNATFSGVNTNTLTVHNAGPALNGNVYHVIVSGAPCGSVTSANVALTVNQRPGVVLAASEYNHITPYVRTSLYTTVSPAGPVYRYEWYKDGVLLPNITTGATPVDVDGFGNYEVVVTNVSTGCATRSNASRISDSAAAAHELFVYPNPSSGQFQVRYYSRNITSSTTHMITVYDSKGAKVYQQVYPIGRVYEEMDVKMENAAAGIYLIELRDNNGKRLATSRVIIK